MALLDILLTHVQFNGAQRKYSSATNDTVIRLIISGFVDAIVSQYLDTFKVNGQFLQHILKPKSNTHDVQVDTVLC